MEVALKPLPRLLLFGTLTLVGCTTGEKIVNIREGLSKAEVIELSAARMDFSGAVNTRHSVTVTDLLVAGHGIAPIIL